MFGKKMVGGVSFGIVSALCLTVLMLAAPADTPDTAPARGRAPAGRSRTGAAAVQDSSRRTPRPSASSSARTFPARSCIFAHTEQR